MRFRLLPFLHFSPTNSLPSSRFQWSWILVCYRQVMCTRRLPLGFNSILVQQGMPSAVVKFSLFLIWPIPAVTNRNQGPESRFDTTVNPSSSARLPTWLFSTRNLEKKRKGARKCWQKISKSPNPSWSIELVLEKISKEPENPFIGSGFREASFTFIHRSHNGQRESLLHLFTPHRKHWAEMPHSLVHQLLSAKNSSTQKLTFSPRTPSTHWMKIYFCVLLEERIKKNPFYTDS